MARAARRPGSTVAASVDPIARVAVDVALPHLDRPFDYLVPDAFADRVRPGSRVRVRFAGQLVDGYVLERAPESEHAGRLAFLERSVSPEVVLTAEISRLARAVADRWAGSVADVLRLAVPPRHARAETADGEGAHVEPIGSIEPNTADDEVWASYAASGTFLSALRAGRAPRAVWPVMPGPQWPQAVSALVAATLASGRGAVVVVPDRRDVDRVDAALLDRLGLGRHVVLAAHVGPAERYRRFLMLSRGEVAAVVGTRAAAFAPVRDLGLVLIWDDGDDLHAEPRAPYWHARDVLVLRAHLAGAAAVVGGHAVTAEGARLVSTGWARWLAARRPELRARVPRVEAGDDAARARQPSAGGRLPTMAWEAAHAALQRGQPVLVQVPRRGFLPALACDDCRTPLRCPACAGPLASTDTGSTPACRWCGRIAAGWTCPECGGRRFRATVVGARRTAEELGRAFPGTVVRTSAQGSVLARVPGGAALVIATPGAEPIAEGGYGAAVLLDGWALLGRADLRAGEEALRRWLNAAALVQPGSTGGRVVVLADSSLRPVQALIRWDPAGYAERELTERAAIGFPPAVTFAELLGSPTAVAELLGATVRPATAHTLGPLPVSTALHSYDSESADAVRALIRVSRAEGAALASALHEAQGVRSARKALPVRVRIDPLDLG